MPYGLVELEIVYPVAISILRSKTLLSGWKWSIDLLIPAELAMKAGVKE
jgi:hypothetical protein